MKIKKTIFKMGKVSIHQEDVTIIHIYKPNNKIHEIIPKKLK